MLNAILSIIASLFAVAGVVGALSIMVSLGVALSSV